MELCGAPENPRNTEIEMENTGMGVIFAALAGNDESADAVRAAMGKTIASLRLDEDEDSLKFVFGDDSKLTIYDAGQNCCESRYMRTDDNLADFVGAKFLGTETKDAPDMEDDYNVHEVQFLEVKTDKGVFTMASHNEHNGYYGGFALRAHSE
jgi:hypothetical protein